MNVWPLLKVHGTVPITATAVEDQVNCSAQCQEVQSTREVVDAQYMTGSIVPVMCNLACVLLTESSHLGTFCSVANCCSGDFMSTIAL